jgi:hypothetical protein
MQDGQPVICPVLSHVNQGVIPLVRFGQSNFGLYCGTTGEGGRQAKCLQGVAANESSANLISTTFFGHSFSARLLWGRTKRDGRLGGVVV